MGDSHTIYVSISEMLGIVATLFGLTWTVILFPHVYRIFQPSIISFPWDETSDTNTNANESTKSNQTVVFAASYNPPHHGHIRMLEYLSKKYDRVIAVVGFNPKKKYLVSPEERANLLREMLKSRTTNVSVEGAWKLLLRDSFSRTPSGLAIDASDVFPSLLDSFSVLQLCRISCGRIYLEVCETRWGNTLLSRNSELGKGWE